MLKKIVSIVQDNWIFIAIALLVIAISAFFFGGSDSEITGCSTCSVGDAGVLVDTELSGCSTCSLGDAGVLLDTETSETEMYNMPDDYYNSQMEIADTIAEVGHNPSEFDAVTEDREEEDEVAFDPIDDYEEEDEVAFDPIDDYEEEDEEEEVVLDPTDYAEQTDDQLVADFYGDQESDEIEDDAEIDYAERERIRKIKYMPLDMDMADGSFTLL
jgi:hypothetical protein